MHRTALAFACVVLFALPVAAQEYTVTVIAILASDKSTTVDPKLAEIAAEARKREKGLTGFRIGRTHAKPMKVGDKETYALTDDAGMEVTIQPKPSRPDRIKVSLKPPQSGEVVYETAAERYFPVMTGYATPKDKERLIVAVMVKPK